MYYPASELFFPKKFISHDLMDRKLIKYITDFVEIEDEYDTFMIVKDIYRLHPQYADIAKKIELRRVKLNDNYYYSATKYHFKIEEILFLCSQSKTFRYLAENDNIYLSSDSIIEYEESPKKSIKDFHIMRKFAPFIKSECYVCSSCDRAYGKYVPRNYCCNVNNYIVDANMIEKFCKENYNLILFPFTNREVILDLARKKSIILYRRLFDAYYNDSVYFDANYISIVDLLQQYVNLVEVEEPDSAEIYHEEYMRKYYMKKTGKLSSRDYLRKWLQHR